MIITINRSEYLGMRYVAVKFPELFDFNKENVVFSVEDFIRKLKEAKKQ